MFVLTPIADANNKVALLAVIVYEQKNGCGRNCLSGNVGNEQKTFLPYNV
jgi:hypothetical protein